MLTNLTYFHLRRISQIVVRQHKSKTLIFHKGYYVLTVEPLLHCLDGLSFIKIESFFYLSSSMPPLHNTNYYYSENYQQYLLVGNRSEWQTKKEKKEKNSKEIIKFKYRCCNMWARS